VYGVVSTSSPRWRPIASSARCNAAVQEFTAIACFTFTAFANADSNCFVFGPVVIHADSKTSLTSRSSVSSISGRANGKYFNRGVSFVLCPDSRI
jgi:hypothetical protein